MDWIKHHIDIWLNILCDDKPAERKVEALKTLVANVEAEIEHPSSCKYCGYTDAKACMGGCSWVAPGVCSQCVVNLDKAKEFLESYAADPDIEKIEVFAHSKGEQTGVLVMARGD